MEEPENPFEDTPEDFLEFIQMYREVGGEDLAAAAYKVFDGFTKAFHEAGVNPFTPFAAYLLMTSLGVTCKGMKPKFSMKTVVAARELLSEFKPETEH